ncbi:MAG: DUF4405 domain-containing protein [Phycisphaerales bacterium]|nr:DUF4405 domain-containing protein [Phycisphaerae bacterium]NNF43306.1 DUF4405 domain-containing protein [Phycisphaerales bacterium]NNM26198.1 DUF4405 domain-containing protein [Phycisphaerales bacterium]
MTPTPPDPPSIARTRLRLLTAFALLIGMVLLLTPRATGIPAHEWVGLAVLVPLFIHLVVDWKWIVGTTRRFFRRTPGRTRFNYVWDWLFFVLVTVASFSGIIISEAALPALGVPVEIDLFWSGIHTLSTRVLMLVMGVHVAMHLGWIFKALTRRPRHVARPAPATRRPSRSIVSRAGHAIIPSLAVAVAAAVVVFAVRPMAGTGWAEALRSNPSVSAEVIGNRPSDVGTIVTDLTWVVLPIGVAAGLTLVVLGIGRVMRGVRKA